MNKEDKELHAIFVAESRENIERAHEALAQIKNSSNKTAPLNDLARAIHTIKGSCPTFGLTEARDHAHEFENRLQNAKDDLSLLDDVFIAKAGQDIETLEQLLSAKKADDKSVAINSHSDFLRIPLNSVSQSLNNIWEIFLTHNQINYAIDRVRRGEIGFKDFFQDWDVLDNSLRRNINELETQLMSMRMTSLNGLFSRMKKIVHSYLEQNANKKISLKLTGEATEVDKRVSDRLTEPLIHLIRNAMDHGIEDLETRETHGKSATGHISISAITTADRVIISVEDDGKGIDPKKILSKAIEKGVTNDRHLSDKEAIDLIFAPGFSTAENVSDVSGRGVGMDSVRTSIQQLGGSVEIETKVGHGSRFAISLPLSLSVISALIFSVNGQKYGANTHDLVEVIKVSPSEVKNNDNQDYLWFRGEFIPTFQLDDVFTSGNNLTESEKSGLIPFVIINSDNQLIGLRLDKIHEDSDIIVKNQPPLAPYISYVDGMSILATGEPIFIVSFAKIAKLIKLTPKRSKEAA